MRKRILFGAGLGVLAVLTALIVWQGSFSFGEYGPSNMPQTYVYWGISTLIFLLTVTLGFMLVRIGVRLYIDRQSGREGSRIKSKLVIGAIALSVMPVVFQVFFSVQVLNFNLVTWFSRPAQDMKWNLIEVGNALGHEAEYRVRLQAQWLAALPETQSLALAGLRKSGFFEALCKENFIDRAWIEKRGGEKQFLCSDGTGSGTDTLSGRASMRAGHGDVVVIARMPVDLARKQAEIQDIVRDYDQRAKDRKAYRNLYGLLLALITLFIVFVATWIARTLAQQIIDPISAVLEAAGEVRRGNLAHRVKVKAIDELATLVRSFNEMMRDLDANSRELERRRRFTEAILESIPTGVISLTADGRIQRYNLALARIFPPEHVARATRLDDLFSREDSTEIRYLMKRARRTGASSRQLDFRVGPQTLHFAVTVAALEEKASSGFVLVIEDTSELLRAQKAAAWHEVARRIAHEIKNPLTPIALSAERIGRLLERATIPAEAKRILLECSQTISQEVESVKALVDEFSQFARFPAAQLAPAHLNEVVENALGVFNGRLDGIEVRLRLGENMPAVNLDKDQFKRAVVNLVDNAAEAMQDALVKQLLVTTAAPTPESVELTIADTGCGVSAEDREKLFLPYFSTKGRGTGLGLAIVNHIIAEHHANIRVEDNTPAGARFVIEIPALIAEPKPMEASPLETPA